MVSGIRFVKMQATGNDFILIDGAQERDWVVLSQVMCDRHFGVGSDGLLVVLPSDVADLRMRMFNPDGSEAEACGNGIRCFAKYAVEDRGIPLRNGEMCVETSVGVRKVYLSWEGETVVKVRVAMGMPHFSPGEIPVLLGERDKFDITPILDYPVVIGDRKLSLSLVSLGNPHAVHFLEDSVDDFPLTEVGPKVEHHPLFPQRVNFEVATVLKENQVKARVWERGAGETLSCGSGACAIAVASLLHCYTGNRTDIILPGGSLTIEWDGKREIFLTGDARIVFRGEWT